MCRKEFDEPKVRRVKTWVVQGKFGASWQRLRWAVTGVRRDEND